MKRRIALLGGVLIALMIFGGHAFAGNASDQEYTAYANLNRYGASTWEVFTGDIAVHPVKNGCGARCPVLPWGTRVYLSTPSTGVSIEEGDGYTRTYTSFSVVDTGDLTWSLHPKSTYWIDIYFGRWIFPDDNGACGWAADTAR